MNKVTEITGSPKKVADAEIVLKLYSNGTVNIIKDRYNVLKFSIVTCEKDIVFIRRM